MTKQEFDEMAALVVRLRRQVEIEQSRATHESRERHALVLQLSAHVDALKQSNAQCSKLLVQNEQLTAELDRMKGDPLPIKLVGKLKDVETSNKTLHSELVEVRAALASVTEQRDSLRTTLASWEAADTAPFVKVPDVADHVMPPVLDHGEPDPANDERDAKLEFRNVVPTAAMIAVCEWWDLVGGDKAIFFKSSTQWRNAGNYGPDRWNHGDCPLPLRPHGMTWQQLDKVMADKKAAESIAAPMPAAEAPMCRTCHECGGVLRPSRAAGSHSVLCCRTERCSRINTAWQDDVSPYHGPCKSAAPVRHE